MFCFSSNCFCFYEVIYCLTESFLIPKGERQLLAKYSNAMAYSRPDEKFVNIRGIIEIRWISDEPLSYRPSVDLYDELAKEQGLDDSYGKKNKQTTEQSFFSCLVCECELKSVVSLRAHCKGTQHMKKARQRKMEIQKRATTEGLGRSAPREEAWRERSPAGIRRSPPGNRSPSWGRRSPTGSRSSAASRYILSI